MRVRPLLTVLAIAAFVAAAGPASAHTEVQRASPSPGEVVPGTVGAVELLFLDPVLPTVEIDVSTATGDPVGGLGTVEHGDDGRTASVSFTPIDRPGDYVVEYRFVAADGDAQSDAYRFSIDPATADDDPSLVGTVAVALVVVALLAAVALAIRRRATAPPG